MEGDDHCLCEGIKLALTCEDRGKSIKIFARLADNTAETRTGYARDTSLSWCQVNNHTQNFDRHRILSFLEAPFYIYLFENIVSVFMFVHMIFFLNDL